MERGGCVALGVCGATVGSMSAISKRMNCKHAKMLTFLFFAVTVHLFPVLHRTPSPVIPLTTETTPGFHVVCGWMYDTI